MRLRPDGAVDATFLEGTGDKELDLVMLRVDCRPRIVFFEYQNPVPVGFRIDVDDSTVEIMMIVPDRSIVTLEAKENCICGSLVLAAVRQKIIVTGDTAAHHSHESDGGRHKESEDAHG